MDDVVLLVTRLTLFIVALADGRDEHVVAHGLIADFAVGGAQLHVVDRAADRLEEALLADAPATRYGREEGPATVRREARRAVVTAIKLQEPDAFIVVVDTSEVARRSPVRVRTVDELVAVSEVELRHTRSQQVVACRAVHIEFATLRVGAEHEVEVVCVLHVEQVVAVEVEDVVAIHVRLLFEVR